jgi:hypothetical protein
MHTERFRAHIAMLVRSGEYVGEQELESHPLKSCRLGARPFQRVSPVLVERRPLSDHVPGFRRDAAVGLMPLSTSDIVSLDRSSVLLFMS